MSKGGQVIPTPARRRAVGAALLLVLAACTGGDRSPAPAASVAASADPAAAYDSLPPCAAAPPVVEPVPDVPGLVLPAGATIQSVSDSGPITTINAYAAATPLDIERDLTQRADLEILHNENEVFETEMLFRSGTQRSFLKAVAVCAGGSRIVAVVVAEDHAGALPSPGAAAGDG